MKQLVYRPYKEPDPKPEKPEPKPKPKPKPKTLSTSMAVAATDKQAITRMLAYQHPTSSLNMGTLSANVKRALPDEHDLQQQVIAVSRKASNEAARIKREGQRLFGAYIERLGIDGLGRLNDTDREFLGLLCQPVSMKDIMNNGDDTVVHEEDDEDEIKGVLENEGNNDDNDDDDDDEDDTDLEVRKKGGKSKGQLSFISSFLRSLYSGNPPKSTGIGIKVNSFISRLQELGLYSPPRSTSALNERMPFTPTDLVRSVAGQLKSELQRMYKNGTCDIYKKV